VKKTLFKVRRDLSVAEQEDQLLSHLRPLLQKAKYEQLPHAEVKRLSNYVELPERGLQVKVNVDDYALTEIWVSGEAHIHHTKQLLWKDLTHWEYLEAFYYDKLDELRRLSTRKIRDRISTWIRSTPMDDDIQYQRVVTIMRKRNTSKVMIKSFKFIPRGSLQVLFPKNIKRVGLLNRLVGMTYVGSVMKIVYDYTYGGSLQLLIPLSILMYRFWYNIDYRRKRYDSTIAQLFYQNNLANNVGVILETVDRAESEAFTSSILLYSALLHDATIAGNTTPSLAEVDKKIERWISEFTGISNLQFDEEAALEACLKYELIRRDSLTPDRFHIIPLDEVVARLHAGRLNMKLVYSATDINDSINSLYRRKNLTDYRS